MLVDQLRGYEGHEFVSWETGQLFNELLEEARAVAPRLNLTRLPVASEQEMPSGPSTTHQTPKELVGVLRQARVSISRAQD